VVFNGWLDLEGPLHFLRRRWAAGKGFRACWVRYFSGETGITLQAHSKRGGYARAGIFVPAALWVDLDYRHKEDLVMGWIRDLRSAGAGGGPGRDASDPEWLQSFPALHDYLTARTGPDGSPRRTATLTIFVDGPAWKCFINERDAGASLCSSGSTVAAALSSLEVMLEDEDTPWRFSDPEPAPGPRKPRKGS